nr:hypothetical protein [Tanacetum cinerariifolium]
MLNIWYKAQKSGKGAGFLWERVGRVMGSSWSSGGVVRSGEKGCYRSLSLTTFKEWQSWPLKCKFEEKYDEGFLVGYSPSSKAFRVYNLETKRVEENLHINFLENKPHVAGKGPTWLFDLDYLTDSMNYQPITVENKANKTAGPKETNNSTGTQDIFDAGNSKMEADHAQEYYVLPLWSFYTSSVKSSKAKTVDKKLNEDTDSKTNKEPVDQEDQAFLEELERLKRQEKRLTMQLKLIEICLLKVLRICFFKQELLEPTDIYEVSRDGIITSASYDDEGAVADFTDLESTVNASHIPTSRIHSIHLTTQILKDPTSAVQTRSKVNKSSRAYTFLSYIQKHRRNNHKDFQHCLFSCFLSQNEPKKISQALEDESWVDAMQEELLQFKIQKVWILVDMPFGNKAIRTKWVYKNKKDVRGVVVRNKVMMVALGHRQEEGIDYDEEVYVSQPPGFIDPKFLNKVYKVVKALYGLHKLLEHEILKKFDFLSVKTASTPIETKKPLVKDEEVVDVNVHLYRSMIDSLMYFAASRPDTMYVVCACSRFQVTPKTSHLQAMKRIFSYLKGQPKLVLWYPGESAFDLESYSDSDYARANLDRNSTTGGCQYLGRRLISWQCKKKTIVATLTAEAEYVAAASCCEQVLWIQNQISTVRFEVMLLLMVTAARLKLTTARVYAAEDDAEGTTCLTNIEILEGLAKMSAKTTSWNEFSTTMESTIICLATNQKFNFSRYILLSLVKNIEAGVPFFMFPRFVQLIINHQLGDMAHHKEIFDTLSLTKKVFVNMKRVGTRFFGEVTPLFDNMLVQVPEEVGILQADTQLIPITTEPSSSKPQRKHNPKRTHTQESEVPPTESLAKQTLPSPSNDPLPSELKSEVIDIKSTYQQRIKKLEGMVERKAQAKAYNLDLDHQEKVLSMMNVNEEEPADVEEVLEVVKAAKLMIEVVTIVGATKVSVRRKRRGVIIQDPEETTTTATVQPKVHSKDKGKAILIEKPKPLKTQAQIKLDEEVRKPLTQAQARRNMIVYLKNMAGFKMDYFKGMTYDEIRPLFEKHYNFNQTFLDEKQKMEEETEELKKHLQIVTNNDSDVKILIIDYKIHTERNRPYFKIIRADGNHMLFISLSTMLKNFNREDLKSLWKIIRDRFGKTKPKNYSDDYLLNTLKIMFEKPNVEASMWKDQKGEYGLAKVKSWKLIESCGFHRITFLTT